MIPGGRMEIQRGFQYKIKIAFQINQKKKKKWSMQLLMRDNSAAIYS